MPPVLTDLWNSFVAFLPHLLWALAILLIAWIIARILKAVTVRVLTSLRLDERLRTQGTSNILGDLVYWLIFLLALPAVLEVLGLESLLVPFQAMVNQVLLKLPSILFAILILIFGLFAARVVRQVVTDLLRAAGIDRFGAQAGVTTAGQGISGLVGLIAYVFVLIPVLIAAGSPRLPGSDRPAEQYAQPGLGLYTGPLWRGCDSRHLLDSGPPGCEHHHPTHGGPWL